MKILKKQKKNSIKIRSIGILWLIVYFLNLSCFNLDTSKFTLDSLIFFKSDLTGKYNYEVKNDGPCKIEYEDFDDTDENVSKIKFDHGITIKSKFNPVNNGQDPTTDLTISTDSDSASIGTSINFANMPIFAPNILQKIISKNDYNVYYVSMDEKNERAISATTKVLVVFKNGKIKVLNDKDFADINTEKDRELKKIKELIMKNEIAKFFDDSMFITSFKGLKKIESEKSKLNDIVTEYENSTLVPSNIKENMKKINEEDFNKEKFKKVLTLKRNFKDALNIVLYENGHKINTMCDGYAFQEEKPNDIIDKFGKNNLTENGCSYKFKDIVFSYSDTNPKELLEIAVKKPILYLDDIKLIGANFNEIQSKLQYYILGIENVSTDKGEIKIVEVPENWSLIVGSDGIIKSGVFHSDAYHNYEKNRGVLTSAEKLKLYDNEIKDFSLYE